MTFRGLLVVLALVPCAARAFAALQDIEVDRRLRFPDPFKNARHSAYLDGFSLHAGVRIHENGG